MSKTTYEVRPIEHGPAGRGSYPGLAFVVCEVTRYEFANVPPSVEPVAYCRNREDADRIAVLLRIDEDRQSRQRQMWPPRPPAGRRRAG